ncbi:MAG: hypothetical protein QW607_10305 [Desulfurococcaceae archaeon]
MLVFKVDFEDFLKLALSVFMVDGARSFIVFRLNPGVLTYFMSEAGNLILIEIEEPKKCIDMDYYILKVNDDVKYECKKGLPKRNILLQEQIIFVIEPEDFTLTELESEKNITSYDKEG